MAIDAKLLWACDRAAKKAKLNRSELVRLALREHLQRVQILEFEQRDQRGYAIQQDKGIRLGRTSGLAKGSSLKFVRRCGSRSAAIGSD